MQYPMNVFDEEMTIAEQVDVEFCLLMVKAGVTLQQLRAYVNEIVERGLVN